MRHTLVSHRRSLSSVAVFEPTSAKELFDQRFRCSLSQCMIRGFQVEECFGMIWEETLEEVELSFREQNELFPELIAWAKRWAPQREVDEAHHS